MEAIESAICRLRMSLKPSQWGYTQILIDLDDITVVSKLKLHQTTMEGNDIWHKASFVRVQLAYDWESGVFWKPNA